MIILFLNTGQNSPVEPKDNEPHAAQFAESEQMHDDSQITNMGLNAGDEELTG